jgi:hypothetical protein
MVLSKVDGDYESSAETSRQYRKMTMNSRRSITSRQGFS